jgi:arsenite oxidase small subunit
MNVNHKEMPMNERNLTRRNFMRAGAAAAGVLIAGRIFPSCTVGQKRYKLGMAGEIVVIKLDDYPFLKETWGHGIFVFKNHPTLIVVNSPDGYVALGANCTHKHCVVDWHDDEKHFICPCHHGRYNLDGSVVSGPPPAPLPRYLVAEEGGKLHITKG